MVLLFGAFDLCHLGSRSSHLDAVDLFSDPITGKSYYFHIILKSISSVNPHNVAWVGLTTEYTSNKKAFQKADFTYDILSMVNIDHL